MMRFLVYAYYSGYVNIDGLDFYTPRAGASNAHPDGDDPHGIYACRAAMLTHMQDVRFSSPAHGAPS